MGISFKSQAIREHMMEGHFGLEKESLRVTKDGYLAHTSHPFGDDPHMDRDFCENQVELITKVCVSVEEAYTEMKRLHCKAVKTLKELPTGVEYLWPFSNPPYVKGEDDIPVAHFEGDSAWKEAYRNYLAAKYGKKKMLFSGIHYNFSFTEDLLACAFAESSVADQREFVDGLYLELAKKVKKRSWFLVYLTAASPVFDGSFFDEAELGKTEFRHLASPRCSEMGYWNDFVPVLSYKNLDTYIQGMRDYVKAGMIASPAEIYCPVRLKPAGKNTLENLQKKGIDHIELRVFDLNPLTPIGIDKEDLEFVHLFLLYLASLPDEVFGEREQELAEENEKQSAHYDGKKIVVQTEDGGLVDIKTASLCILNDMEHFFAQFDNPEFLKTIYRQADKVMSPSERYCVKVKQQYGKNYVRDGLKLADRYADMLVPAE